MDSGKGVVCGEEAVELLNCVVDQTEFDKDKCVGLLLSLRQCVLNKKVKKFSLADQGKQSDANPIHHNKKA